MNGIDIIYLNLANFNLYSPSNMNFKYKIFPLIVFFLFHLNSISQTSWHINKIEVCKYDRDVKKWKDCIEENEKMAFYFNQDLSQITMIDMDDNISYFDIESVKPADDEKTQIDFEVVNSKGKDLSLRLNFDSKSISIFDFSDPDDWKVLSFSFEASILYGNFVSDNVEISKWDSFEDKYVNATNRTDLEFYIDLGFSTIRLEDKNDSSSQIESGIRYSDYNSEGNWAVFQSSSSDDFKTLVVIGDNDKVSSLFIFTDLKEGRYQQLLKLNDLVRIEKNSKINSNEIENSAIWKGTGSGIIFSTDGYIATNYHVIENANSIEVEFKNRGKIRKFNAEVIKSDPKNDLAILKINDDSFEDLPSILYNFKTQSSDIGQSVFALGYPKSNLMGTDLKFTDGKISSKTGALGDVTHYQSTTPIQSGNSGGPLFDTNANLIAINSSKIVAEDIENVSYSIKTIYLIPLIDALPENVSLPNSKFLEGKDFTEQFKVLEKYVTLIRIK